MTIDPDQLRAEVAQVLAGVPDPAGDPSALEGMDIDVVAARLEQAHDLLVQALNPSTGGSRADRRRPEGERLCARRARVDAELVRRGLLARSPPAGSQELIEAGRVRIDGMPARENRPRPSRRMHQHHRDRLRGTQLGLAGCAQARSVRSTRST